MSSTPELFNILNCTIASEGAMLLASLGPGSNPNEVVSVFTMIGMGDDARMWRSRVRNYKAASEKAEAKLKEAMPAGASMFDMIIAMDSDSVRLLRDEAAARNSAAAAAWIPLGKIVELVKAKLPKGDVP